MSHLLWGKGAESVDLELQRFLAGEDVVCDRLLFPHDLVASKAHVAGLARIGALSVDEAACIRSALDELGDKFRRGEFVLDERYEDGHSAIEAYLTEKLGDAGKKVHIGRSRNDQVLVALRLWLREALATADRLLWQGAGAFLARAEADAMTPMPGYTHLQRAVPSSVGLWMAAFAEAFIDDLELVRATARWIDRSPLGSAAGYGTSLPLDRVGVAAELGFPSLQWNALYVQNSRGKLELAALGALAQPLLDLRRFAWDLSLFTTTEFGFVRLPERLTTGSSIMPNKRNPDVVELLRASYGVLAGATAELGAILSLPSGYQRDLQVTKPPTLRAVQAALAALARVPDLVASFELDRERLRAAVTPGLFAAERAVERSLRGVPFRDAYRQVASELGAIAADAPETSLERRVSPGGPGALGLADLRARLEALRP